MRATVLEEFGKPLEVQEVELADPERGTGRRVAGSSFGGVKGRDEVPGLVQLYMQGEIDVAPFVSHRIALDEVNRGFELMQAQDGIRSVIEFN